MGIIVALLMTFGVFQGEPIGLTQNGTLAYQQLSNEPHDDFRLSPNFLRLQESSNDLIEVTPGLWQRSQYALDVLLREQRHPGVLLTVFQEVYPEQQQLENKIIELSMTTLTLNAYKKLLEEAHVKIDWLRSSENLHVTLDYNRLLDLLQPDENIASKLTGTEKNIELSSRFFSQGWERHVLIIPQSESVAHEDDGNLSESDVAFVDNQLIDVVSGEMIYQESDFVLDQQDQFLCTALGGRRGTLMVSLFPTNNELSSRDPTLKTHKLLGFEITRGQSRLLWEQSSVAIQESRWAFCSRPFFIDDQLIVMGISDSLPSRVALIKMDAKTGVSVDLQPFYRLTSHAIRGDFSRSIAFKQRQGMVFALMPDRWLLGLNGRSMTLQWAKDLGEDHLSMDLFSNVLAIFHATNSELSLLETGSGVELMRLSAEQLIELAK